jgi:hypothetical protein
MEVSLGMRSLQGNQLNALSHLLKTEITNLTLWLAMPFAKADLAKLGGTEPYKGAILAHLQLRNESDAHKVHIRGPSRETEEEAQRDLDQIRAAGAVGRTREELSTL